MTTGDEDEKSQAIPINPWIELLIETYEALLPSVQRMVIDRGAIIEACPTSNIIVGEMADYNQHPIFDWLTATDGRMTVTVNTDDPGIFHANIQDEFSHLWAAGHDLGIAPAARRDILDGVRRRGIENYCMGLNGVEVRSVLALAMADLVRTGRGVSPRSGAVGTLT
jgi:hypothetical protein